MSNLTAEALTAAVARDTGHTKATVKAVLDSLAFLTASSLINGETVVLPGLGRLHPHRRAEHQRRNPATGEQMTVPAKLGVKFSPAKALTKTLNF